MGLRPGPEHITNQTSPPSNLPEGGLDKYALFLDFDGTLVEIAAGPSLIDIPSTLPGLLRDLCAATHGAMALVSGRSVEALSTFLPDVPCALVGGHGAELRLGGRVQTHPLEGAEATRRIGEACTEFADRHAGLEAELKPTGAVIHFRQAPHAESSARRFAEELQAAWPVFELHDAKMAIELRPNDVGKDVAIQHLLKTPPFEGRRPIYFGDDRTDEPALDLVARAGGISVHIGEGPTRAEFRLSTPSQVLDTLKNWIA